MSGTRSNLKLNLAVTAGFLLIVAVGLAAPPLWRRYQEARRTLVIRIRADGTISADGFVFRLDGPAWEKTRNWRHAQAAAWPQAAGPEPSGEPAGNREFRRLVERRAKKMLSYYEMGNFRFPDTRLRIVISVDPATPWQRVRPVLQAGEQNLVREIYVNNQRLPFFSEGANGPPIFTRFWLKLEPDGGGASRRLYLRGSLRYFAPAQFDALAAPGDFICEIAAAGQVPIAAVLQAIRDVEARKTEKYYQETILLLDYTDGQEKARDAAGGWLEFDPEPSPLPEVRPDRPETGILPTPLATEEGDVP